MNKRKPKIFEMVPNEKNVLAIKIQVLMSHKKESRHACSVERVV